jgi:hypothetical protein
MAKTAKRVAIKHGALSLESFVPGLIGRQTELAILDGLYKQKEPVFLAIYGRRRAFRRRLMIFILTPPVHKNHYSFSKIEKQF